MSGEYASSSNPENTVAFILGQSSNDDGLDEVANEKDLFSSQSYNNSKSSTVISNYSVVLAYSGSRWYGSIMPPGGMSKVTKPLEYHAFWNSAYYGERTFLISQVTHDGSPENSEFYQMRERSEYGGYGILVPIMDLEGEGLFYCLADTDCNDESFAEPDDATPIPNQTRPTSNTTDARNETSNEAVKNPVLKDGE